MTQNGTVELINSIEKVSLLPPSVEGYSDFPRFFDSNDRLFFNLNSYDHYKSEIKEVLFKFILTNHFR